MGVTHNSFEIIHDIVYTALRLKIMHCLICSSCGIIDPPSPMTASCQGASTLESIILPYTLIWNPLEQFHTFFENGLRCPRDDCISKVHLYRWNAGQNGGHCPRLLHEIRCVILLVPAVYKCDNGHELLSTDPYILGKFPEGEYIPFILFHRSGITREFGRTIISLTLEGLTFSAIERFIRRRRSENIVSLQLRIACIPSTTGLLPIVSSCSVHHLYQPYPSNDILSRCFFRTFLKTN